MVQLKFELLLCNLVSQVLRHQAVVQVLQLPAHPQQPLELPGRRERHPQPVRPVELLVPPVEPGQLEPGQLEPVPITVIPVLPIVINQLEVEHEFT